MNLARSLVKFFDKPRGKILCFFGAVLVAPSLTKTRRNVRKLEKKLNSEIMLLGRLELLATILTKWWKQ